MNYDKRNYDHRYGITRYNKRLIKKYKRLFIFSFITCLILVVWVAQLYQELEYIKIENDLLKISRQTDDRDFNAMGFTIDSLLFTKMFDSVKVIPITIDVEDDTVENNTDTVKIINLDTIQKIDTTSNDTI